MSETTNYQTGGMLNWSHDVPAGYGEKEKMERVLAYIKAKAQSTETLESRGALPESLTVLEVGVFAGVSLIEILSRLVIVSPVLPKIPFFPIGYAIDIWKNYVESDHTVNYSTETSAKTTVVSTLEAIEEKHVEALFDQNVRASGHTIVKCKGDSTTELLKLVKQEKQFDFVYIDGSHLLLDCYSDMVLGWSVTKVGGVMAVDDIIYNRGIVLESPNEAVIHFLKKYDGSYKHLETPYYRLYIEKI